MRITGREGREGCAKDAKGIQKFFKTKNNKLINAGIKMS